MGAQKQAGVSTPEAGEKHGITQEDIDSLLEMEQSEEGDITLDETFDLLRNQRRRDVLLYLAEAEDNTATVGELAKYVAAKENDIDEAALTSTQRKRVYIGLYQCHLPKMNEVGVVDYDQDRGTVILQNSSQLFRYLPDADTNTERSVGFLSVALLVALVVAVGLIGIGPIAAVPAAAWAMFSTAALVALAVYHTVR